jgi:tripartite-type tricarboxylate transporter receptor subunit TctC
MTRKLLALAFVGGASLLSLVTSVRADVYTGQTVRLVVGFSPGGGFDLHARILARHLSKHVPGKPTIIVENMPGAGSLTAAGYLARIAKPDGLTVGMVSGATVMGQLEGRKGINFDVRDFEIVASPSPYKTVCVVSKASGVKDAAMWKASSRPVVFGMTGPGASAHDVPLVINAALGLPVRPVAGYPGTAKIRLAVESGEVDGACFSWDATEAIWKGKLDSGDIIPVLQTYKTNLPELPNVTNAMSLADSDEARELIRLGIHAPALVNRYYTLPPKTPKDRVAILRKAFMETFKDPEFLENANKARLEIDPNTGEEVMQNVNALLSMKPELASKLKDIIGRKAIR